MIFTRRFGALAARPTFETIVSQADLVQLRERYEAPELEYATHKRAS